jgi:leader peptidase (prepilin peptidase)/N-methyltransferase
MAASLEAAIGATPAAWSLAAVLLAFLAAAAARDGRTGRVPDSLLLLGAGAAAGGLLALRGWLFVLERAGAALGFGLVLWGANELYFRWKKRDGFGMGDAKWTALAVLAFGLSPAFAAWIFGAWLALFWLGLRRFVRGSGQGDAVRFSPFLFLGLLPGLLF